MATRKKPFIINEETNNDLLFPKEFGRGLEVEAIERSGYAGAANPFPKEFLIPRSYWPAMLKERKERGMTFRERSKRAGRKIKSQARLNYCWVFAVASAIEGANINQAQPYVELSPTSAGAVIKNGRNVGGWGLEALQHISDVGIAPHSMWPSLSLDTRLDTPEMRAEKARWRCVDWFTLEPRNHDELISAIFRHLLIPIGLNWWRHEVLACDLEEVDGEICPVFENSWDESYGDGGYGVLQGRRALADDAVTPLTVMAR